MYIFVLIYHPNPIDNNYFEDDLQTNNDKLLRLNCSNIFGTAIFDFASISSLRYLVNLIY